MWRRVGNPFALAFALSALEGCLPGDTRPEPGSVLTTVTGSSAAREGFTSADGWQISFQRVLLSAGPMQLGDDCQKYAEYSEPGYDRVLELTGSPAQKLSIMFGLGTCDIDFELSPPSDDAVLGSGVSEADKTAMRTPGSDAWVENDGSVLHVEGTAFESASSVAFAWDIRQSLFFTHCSVIVDGVAQPGLELERGKRLTYDLLLEPEGLFRDDVDRATAALRFQPFADADALRGDGDGQVTLGELDAVPLADLLPTGPYGGSGGGVETLAAYLYRTLWPTLLRYRDTGTCSVALEED